MFEEATNFTDFNMSELSVLEMKRLAFPRWGFQIAGFLLLLIGTFGIIENILVLYTFSKTKPLRSATNIFIMGLASSDLSMALFGNPLATINALNGSWFVGDFFCTWEGFVVFFLGLSALYILMAIAVDRYIVITKPLSASMITKRVSVLSVGACFLFALFWALMPLFGWGSYGLEAPGVFCGLDYEERSFSSTSYMLSIAFFCFFLPIITMIYSYYHVYMTVHNIAASTVWDMKSRVARKNLRMEKRMLKSVFIMCSVFVICWAPYAVVSFWQAFGNPHAVPLWLTLLPGILAKSELVWNPIIYVATNKQFRKAFYAVLPCKGIRDVLVKIEEEEPSSKETEMSSTTTSKAETAVVTQGEGNAVHPENTAAPTKVDC